MNSKMGRVSTVKHKTRLKVTYRNNGFINEVKRRGGQANPVKGWVMIEHPK